MVNLSDTVQLGLRVKTLIEAGTRLSAEIEYSQLEVGCALYAFLFEPDSQWLSLQARKVFFPHTDNIEAQQMELIVQLRAYNPDWRPVSEMPSEQGGLYPSASWVKMNELSKVCATEIQAASSSNFRSITILPRDLLVGILLAGSEVVERFISQRSLSATVILRMLDVQIPADMRLLAAS